MISITIIRGGKPMKYTLMHKQKKILEMELDETTGFILKINKVYAADHLPVGISCRRGIVDRKALNEWWVNRSIPASRSGVRYALEYLNISSTTMLLARCFGLSLSDQYWIKPQGEDVTWDKINFFDNSFSEDIGDVLFGMPKNIDGFDFSSPDNTSDGCLKKRWKIINGKRCLVKGGSNPFQQQAFNEVIATKIMERLGIPCVEYSIVWDSGLPYSVCEDFVTVDTELVSAWHILQTQKEPNNVSLYQHFINCCEKLGVMNIVQDLDKMLVLDYIIANEDRHLNNFGLLRNAETLEWLGFAPIYDSGSSLSYDKLASQIRLQTEITCKPFKKNHLDQVKLVSNFSWIDFDKLLDVGDIIREVFAEEKAKEFIDESRIESIIDGVKKRIETLQEIAITHTLTIDTMDGDVEENIAENYMSKKKL